LAEKFRTATPTFIQLVHWRNRGNITSIPGRFSQRESAGQYHGLSSASSAILLSFMFVYSRHFVQNVTDVVHVMQKGISDANFNLEVSIRKDFEHDEIFVLAKSYNEVLLPEKMKSKASGESTDTGGLSMDDFLK
jgi:methyl-accepting chemotaxis protein